jgi:hypothetical protein
VRSKAVEMAPDDSEARCVWGLSTPFDTVYTIAIGSRSSYEGEEALVVCY